VATSPLRACGIAAIKNRPVSTGHDPAGAGQWVPALLCVGETGLALVGPNDGSRKMAVDLVAKWNEWLGNIVELAKQTPSGLSNTRKLP